jgi:membrane-bound lytic murein transglycosylase D
MHRFRLVNLVFLLCFLCLPAIAVQGQTPEKSFAPISIAESSASTMAADANDSNSPAGMMEIMNASSSKYREGSSRIKAGDAEKARLLFNEAVDIVLQSNWELASTPTLNQFLQDLIQRIQQDESRYLLGPVKNDSQIENAVVDDLDNMDLMPVTIDPSLADAPFSDLAETKYEIPITINDMVVQSLDFYLNRGRKYFVDGLLRSGRYQPLIEKVFREESIPLELMYLAQVESFFQPHAVSKAQAKGIWQFTKDTAIRYGLKVTRDVDERSDPEKSTRAAAHYLKDLFAVFKDWNLVLAAYNWGEGKVQRLIDSTGLKDFWQLVDLRRRLPEETRKHIPLIQASVILARNPEKYGLPTNLDPPLKYTEVSVSKPIDLRAAAKILSTTIDELKKLNPALRGNTTPANYPNYQLKVPAGTDPKAHEQLNSLPAAKIKPVSEYGSHKVKSGQTLTKIAALYNVSVKDLEKANHLSSTNTIRTGAIVKVPGRMTVASNSEKSLKSKGKTVKSKSRSDTRTSAARKSTKHTSSK